MKQKKKLKSKYVLLIFIVLSVILIAFTILVKKSSRMYQAFGNVIAPVEKAFTKAGHFFGDSLSVFKDKNALLEENESLKTAYAELSEQITSLQIENQMLKDYKELYQLDQSYSQYNKLAANVISNDTGNWFESFLIDKGQEDGIAEGMNVIARGGLVGKIVAVGRTWSKVRSIIDTASYVSVKGVGSGDYGYISGDSELKESGKVRLEQFYDSDDNTGAGELIVTSNISDVYWPDIVVGYLSDISMDANNLTKTGSVALTVDFEHLRQVMVITGKKEVAGN